MITYGGMSRKPITVPTAPFIFKDISLKGFWMSRWSATASLQEKQDLIASLCEIDRKGYLRLETQTFDLEDYENAIKAATTPFKSRKALFKISKE